MRIANCEFIQYIDSKCHLLTLMLFEICITLSTQERILAECPSFSLQYNESEWGLEPASSKKHYKSSQSDEKNLSILKPYERFV